MSKYVGDFTAGKTVRIRFNTSKADGTPITLAGTPAVSVYKGSTTESTSGVTLTVDYDSRTGMHDLVIDTSADGTFYAAANDFDAVITTGTVDSISVVGTVVGTFSLANRSALRPTTADRTLDVSSGGEAGLDWANIGSPTTTVGLSGTTVATVTTTTTASTVTTVSDKTGYSLSSSQIFNVTGNITGNLSGSVGSVTGAVGSVTGAVGSVTGNVGGNVVGTVGSVSGAVGSVTAAVTVGGYSAGQDPATLQLGATAASWNTSGTIGAKINSAASAGDPWATALPGSYVSGTAGYILGNKTGFSLAAAGLDAVVVETGVNARQALAMIGSAVAGKASGLDTSTAVYYAMGASGTTTARITATTDANGNRTATTLTIPA